MAGIDLPGALKAIGAETLDDLNGFLADTALAPEVRQQAIDIGAGGVAALASAGASKAAGDAPGFEEAMKEVRRFEAAGKALATAEVLYGLAAAERAERKATAALLSLGMKAGLALLGALL